MNELLQGVTGTLTLITGLIVALTALIKALIALIKAIQKWRRKQSQSRDANVVPHPDDSIKFVQWNSLIIGIISLILTSALFDHIRSLSRISDSEERTNIAWRYLKQGEADPVTQRAFDADALNHAIRISDAVILELKGMADAKQAALIRNGTPPPPTGEVSSEQRKAIMAYGPLNDVATCLWIKGRSWDYLSKTNEAWQAYSQLTNYPHARTWDPRGWFWSPTEDALGRLGNRAAP